MGKVELMSREEAEDTAIKRIVEVCKMCNTDKLTSTLYSYSGYLVEGVLEECRDWQDRDTVLNIAVIAVLRHFCENGYLDQEKIQEEYVRALQQGIIDYTMPF